MGISAYDISVTFNYILRSDAAKEIIEKSLYYFHIIIH